MSETYGLLKTEGVDFSLRSSRLMNNIYVFITVFLSEYNDMCNLQASLSVLNFKYTHVLCFNGVQIVSENLDIK